MILTLLVLFCFIMAARIRFRKLNLEDDKKIEVKTEEPKVEEPKTAEAKKTTKTTKTTKATKTAKTTKATAAKKTIRKKTEEA